MIKKIFITIIGILKAFWNATVKTAIGIVVIYLLAGLIKGMEIDASKITDLLTMSVILIKYWLVFWMAFFMRDLYYEIRMELSD